MMNASLVLKVLLLFTQVETMIFLNKSSLLQSSAAALHNVNDLKSFCIYLLKVLFSNHYPQISPSNISLKIDHENCSNMLFKAAPSAAFRHLIYPVNPYDTSAFKRKRSGSGVKYTSLNMVFWSCCTAMCHSFCQIDHPYRKVSLWLNF